MKRLLPLLMLAAALGVGACETTVEIDLPDHDGVLVVNSVFAADSTWHVTVSRSRGMQQAGELDTVDDATVTLFEDGQEVATLFYVPQRPDPAWPDLSYYTTATHRPRAGHIYTIRVEAPGLEPVEAATRLPLPPTFEVEVQEIGREMHDHGGRVRYEATLSFDESEGTGDHYELYVLERTTHRYQRWDGQDTYEVEEVYISPVGFSTADPLLREGSSPDLDEDGTASYYEGARFSDRSIEGRSVELGFRFSLWRHPESSGLEEERDVLVVLAATSEDYFRFRRTRDINYDTEGNPFAEPVPIYTNVEGGFGIFAGFTPAAEMVVQGRE